MVDVLWLLFRTALKLEKGNSVWLTLRLAEGEAYGDAFQLELYFLLWFAEREAIYEALWFALGLLEGKILRLAVG